MSAKCPAIDPSGEDGGEEGGGRFMAGALWMGRKAVAIVDEMGEEVREQPASQPARETAVVRQARKQDGRQGRRTDR